MRWNHRGSRGRDAWGPAGVTSVACVSCMHGGWGSGLAGGDTFPLRPDLPHPSCPGCFFPFLRPHALRALSPPRCSHPPAGPAAAAELRAGGARRPRAFLRGVSGRAGPRRASPLRRPQRLQHAGPPCLGGGRAAAAELAPVPIRVPARGVQRSRFLGRAGGHAARGGGHAAWCAGAGRRVTNGQRAWRPLLQCTTSHMALVRAVYGRGREKSREGTERETMGGRAGAAEGARAREGWVGCRVLRRIHAVGRRSAEAIASGRDGCGELSQDEGMDRGSRRGQLAG